MKIIIIDAEKLTSKSDAHEYLANCMSFPDYYGKNLDALADCLSEIKKNTSVIVKNTTHSGEYAKAIFEVFDEFLKKDFRVIYF